jgi:hypothetical protein
MVSSSFGGWTNWAVIARIAFDGKLTRVDVPLTFLNTPISAIFSFTVQIPVAFHLLDPS